MKRSENTEGEILFAMRKKLSADVIGLFVISILLFGAGLIFGAVNQTQLLADISTVLLVATLLFMLDYLTRTITVDEDGFTVWHVWVFYKRILWEDVKSYREKKSEGGYNLEKSCEWYNETYTVTLYREGKLPMRISNDYIEYKQFKKMLAQKGIKRERPKKKKR